MTPADYRAWRRRMGLTRAALLTELRAWGWASLSPHTVDTWQQRGPPEHAQVAFALMERLRVVEAGAAPPFPTPGAGG